MANGDLDVGRLRLLREVGLRGTIAGAARSLGLTPSAVSQQLAVLEREAGTSLVDRSPRGVSLTGAGHALAARAGEVLDVLSAARADLDRMGGALGGPVTVAAVASAALTFVSAAARDLVRTHAGIDLTVEVAEPERSVALLLAGDVEVAIVDEYDYVPLALPDGIVARDLLAEPLVLVAPAGWDGWPESSQPALADLAAESWIMPPDDATCGRAVRSACRAAGFEPDVRWTSDDMLVLVRAVAAGHGIAVLPRLSVAADAGRVDLRALRSPVLGRRLRAVARASALARPSVSAVVDAIASQAARGAS
ncbi:MAG TPA: LysR family transcriptional regulator [Jatrophihabitans sp.]|jgi:DNA-binding transcriptional LysR family regulator